MYNKRIKEGDFMNKDKILKLFSIVFECSFIGSVILYVYNYYVGSKKYDVIPEQLQKNLDMFILIGIVSLIAFLLIKLISYMMNKEEIVERKELTKEEIVKKNIEEVLTERVIIYKDSYDVPKEKRMTCPNCKNIIDKEAFICVKCGYLLKPIQNNSVKIVKSNGITKKELTNILVNIGLVIAIVICVVLILNIAIERGII